jgi:hypothetical protein
MLFLVLNQNLLPFSFIALNGIININLQVSEANIIECLLIYAQ